MYQEDVKMVEIKKEYLVIGLLIVAIFGILIIANFALYYINELYQTGVIAFIAMLEAIVVAEVLLIRPIEYAIRIYRKGRKEEM